MSLKISFLENDQTEEVLRFFNNTQSDRERQISRSREEFEWLFIDGVVKPSVYAIASDVTSDEIIGTNAGIYIPMISSSGELILTCKSEDSLLSLDLLIKFGKRDVFKELLSALEERYKADNINFVWGFTKAKNSFKRCGYSISNHIQASFYVIKPWKFYKIRTKQLNQITLLKKFRLAGFAYYCFFRQTLLSVSTSRFVLKEIKFDEIDEKTLLSFLPENVFTIYTNKEFLNWRIIRNPSSMKYGVLKFTDSEGNIVSYFIFSFNKENTYFVEQFLFNAKLSDNEKIQIMKKAYGFIKKRKAIMIRAMGFSNNYLNIKEMELLKKTGFYFFENRDSSYFIFKNINDQIVSPKDIYLSRLNTLGVV
jgi:hypothetical protein